MLDVAALPLPVAAAAILGASLLLWKAADWFIEGAVGVARRFNMPPMLVGLVFVSLGTTAPELATSVLAALQGAPEAALGNAMGSIVVDEGLALGLAALLAAKPIAADPSVLRSSGPFLAAMVVLAFFLLLDGELARWEGALLFGAFIAYSVYWYGWERPRFSQATAVLEQTLEEPPEAARMSTTRIVCLFLAGLAGVLAGAEVLLMSALAVAYAFEISPALIGMTVIALGTSIPEIATTLASVLKGQSSVGVGNIIGSDILNICCVAGLSAIANPLPIERDLLFVVYPSMTVIVLTMLFMLRRGHQLTRANGAVLLGLYGLHLVILWPLL